MKVQAIFFLCCLSAGISVAQPIRIVTVPGHDLPLEAEYVKPGDPVMSPFNPYPETDQASKKLNEHETVIGTTCYDLQSNKALSNRFVFHDDGTMGAVWNMGFEGPGFADRGTGYNFFDGNSWEAIPGSRIEKLRTGWPSYASLGPYGEAVVSTDFTASSIRLLTRYFRGAGEWVESVFTYSNGPSKLAWPRIITSGPDHLTIHLLANTVDSYQGMSSAIVYSRSLDGGRNWETENTILEGMGPGHYRELSADGYIWAEPRGNTIAFLVVSAWHDLFMMKSTDNGMTWEKTVIWEHPYPFFDWSSTVTDTFFCVDNSAGIALDKQGKAHVVFGISRVLHKEKGSSYSLFPYVDGIGYWNETMPTFSADLNSLAPPQLGYPGSEMEENFNYIGWSQDVNGDGEIELFDTPTGFPMVYREFGLSTMPSVTVDNNGNVLVIFASTTETYTNFEFNFKHIWARAYQMGSWGSFVDLTSDVEHFFDECIYPAFGGVNEDSFHFIYMCDPLPGLSMDGSGDYTENRIIHAVFPEEELLTGIVEPVPGALDFQVFQNYPNPFGSQTNVRVTLRVASSIRLEVRNTYGQLVLATEEKYSNPGVYFIEIDGRNLAKGVYFYTLFSGGQAITRKMVKD